MPGSSNTTSSFSFLGLKVGLSSGCQKLDVSLTTVSFLKLAHTSANVLSLNSHELNNLSVPLLNFDDMTSTTKNKVKLGIKMSIQNLKKLNVDI